jgi:ribosome modulation factor
VSEVARNFNHAFERGYQERRLGCQTWQNPYQARYARNAWRAGWDKADMERTIEVDKATADIGAAVSRL